MRERSILSMESKFVPSSASTVRVCIGLWKDKKQILSAEVAEAVVRDIDATIVPRETSSQLRDANINVKLGNRPIRQRENTWFEPVSGVAGGSLCRDLLC